MNQHDIQVRHTPTSNTSTGICAVVVAYFPDLAFADRLLVVLPQVDALVVVDNTPGGGCIDRLESLTGREGHLTVIENGQNLGIAKALNQGLEQAQSLGCEWLLTLDQDTSCYADAVQTLLRTRDASALPPSVVGGNYLDPRSGKTKVPEGTPNEWLEQKTVITSGCLVKVAIAQGIGGFREDYFIDQVDHEFCLRMRAQGHLVIISRNPVMTHSVGEPNGARVPFLGALPNHSPLRKYYIARNSLVTVSTYWRQEPGWCARRLIRLALGLLLMATLEKKRLIKVKAFAAGTMDALSQRMGPSQQAWLYNSE